MKETPLIQKQSNMKLRFFTLGVLLFSLTSEIKAQIGQSRSDIISEYGYNYETGSTDDGTEYLSYEREFSSDQSGAYISFKVIYFTEAEDGTQFCHYWKILEPSSETNAWVSSLNERLVKMGYMEWKDYETNTLYKLEIEDKICILTSWYDLEKK